MRRQNSPVRVSSDPLSESEASLPTVYNNQNASSLSSPVSAPELEWLHEANGSIREMATRDNGQIVYMFTKDGYSIISIMEGNQKLADPFQSKNDIGDIIVLSGALVYFCNDRVMTSDGLDNRFSLKCIDNDYKIRWCIEETGNKIESIAISENEDYVILVRFHNDADYFRKYSTLDGSDITSFNLADICKNSMPLYMPDSGWLYEKCRSDSYTRELVFSDMDSETKWELETDLYTPISYSISSSKTELLLVQTGSKLVALNYLSGEEAWSNDTDFENLNPLQFFMDDRILLYDVQFGDSGAMKKIHLGLCAIDNEGNLYWQNDMPTINKPSHLNYIIYDDYNILASWGEYLVLIDEAGNLIWQISLRSLINIDESFEYFNVKHLLPGSENRIIVNTTVHSEINREFILSMNRVSSH